jgi:hypothetical protein
MVSADFLASDFITDNELQPLLKSAEDHTVDRQALSLYYGQKPPPFPGR